MQLTFLHGYPDYIGKRFAFVGYGSGPASYVNTATFKTSGDPVLLPRYDNYIDSLNGDYLSVSGNYLVRFVGSAVGARATWVAHWYPIATPGTEVANAVNLSAEQVQFGGFGGVY
jgi:hypothetical protein